MRVHVEILGRSRLGWARQARAGRGSTHCGEESPQQSGRLWRGMAGHGAVRLGTVGRGKYTASHGGAAVCAAWLGYGVAWKGAAVPGLANTLLFKEGRSLRLGSARPGMASHSRAWLGTAWPGAARPGLAGHGKHTASLRGC